VSRRPIDIDLRHTFAFILLLTTVSSVQAQKTAARPTAELEAKQMQQKDSINDFRANFIRASEDYKASLQKLLALYENDVKRLSEQSAKRKELYLYGLISRQEYETTTGDITEAQVKVDEVRKQLATVEITIAEARRQPQPYELRSGEMAARSQIAHSWTTGNARIDALIRENGARYGVDPYFIFCVIQQESRFSSTALSMKGARGLMQLMPGTAARYGVINANDPAQNIMGGTRYLKDLLQLFHGRIDLVLAGYNAGEGAVIRHGHTIPPYKETQDYVRLISVRYLRRSNSARATGKGNGAGSKDKVEGRKVKRL
jgi:soluble lytic murein transglycosylase-like protein